MALVLSFRCPQIMYIYCTRINSGKGGENLKAARIFMIIAFHAAFLLAFLLCADMCPPNPLKAFCHSRSPQLSYSLSLSFSHFSLALSFLVSAINILTSNGALCCHSRAFALHTFRHISHTAEGLLRQRQQQQQLGLACGLQWHFMFTLRICRWFNEINMHPAAGRATTHTHTHTQTQTHRLFHTCPGNASAVGQKNMCFPVGGCSLVAACKICHTQRRKEDKSLLNLINCVLRL